MQKDGLKEFTGGKLELFHFVALSHFLGVYEVHFELMSLEAQWVLDKPACTDALSCFPQAVQKCFPLAVQQVSADSAPSSGINSSFLQRISSSLITPVFKVNWVAREGGQLSSQSVAYVCMCFGF